MPSDCETLICETGSNSLRKSTADSALALRQKIQTRGDQKNEPEGGRSARKESQTRSTAQGPLGGEIREQGGKKKK